jgi:hypothetical protein
LKLVLFLVCLRVRSRVYIYINYIMVSRLIFRLDLIYLAISNISLYNFFLGGELNNIAVFIKNKIYYKIRFYDQEYY